MDGAGLHSPDDAKPADFSSHKRKRSRLFRPYRRKSSSSSRPDIIVFRLLCPESQIRSVIGKGGSVVRSIREDTGALIRVEDAVPGSEERVVTISIKEVRSLNQKRKAEKEVQDKDAENASNADEFPALSNPDGDDEATAPKKDDNADEQIINKASVSPVQEALLRIHTRICEGEHFSGEETDPETSVKITRLLVPVSQVGCLLGRKGKIMEKMRQDTGAQIRILPKYLIPACALPTDEVVQIIGDLATVRKALHVVSSHLQENPPKDRRQIPTPIFPIGSVTRQSIESFHAIGNMFPQRNFLESEMDFWPSFSPPRHGIMEGSWHPFFHSPAPFMPAHVTGSVETLQPMELDVKFRLLCPSERIGSIIGRGGGIVRILREETGAKIHIEETVSDSDEQLIHISAIEMANKNISRAQEAVMRVHFRIAERGQDKDGLVTVKLLVPSDQIGCLIGKGGNIITEMRKETHASIKIYGKGQFSFPASGSDELVQITGDMKITQDALLQITTRLRNNMIREKFDLGTGDNMFTQLPGPFMHGGGPTRNFISPIEGPTSAFGKSFEPVSSGRSFYPLSESGFRSNLPRSQSPNSWTPDFTAGGDPTRLQPQLERENVLRRDETPLITSTSIEVVVPEHVISSIIGPSGNNLAQICEISGANVRVQELLPGATERTIEISGTPDQTHAAQSLLQAFIFSGQ